MLETCPVHAAKKESPWIFSEEKIFSYAQIDHKISCMTQGLENLGIREGRCIAFTAKNSVEVICLLFALSRKKAVATLLSPFLKEQTLKDQLGRLDNPLFLDEVQIAKLFHSSLPSKEVAIDPYRPFIQLFTSGSTGKPKIAVLSLANFYFSALGSSQVLQMSSQDNWLLSLPLFHVSGLCILFRSLISGSSISLCNKPLEEALSLFPITRISLVPTQLFRLIEKPEIYPRLASLTTLLMGGASLSETLRQKAKSLHLPIRMSWGLTEMASHVTLEDSFSLPSSGKVVPFREVHLSETGEILVKGETLFLGYFSKERGISKPYNSEGWFETGDLGFFDEEKNLHFLGRKDTMFTSGGENIFPEEIETLLKKIEGVIQAYVVPVDNPEWGNIPVAFIECAKDKERSSEELKALLREKLSSLKIPKHFFPLKPSLSLKTHRQTLIVEAKLLLKELAIPL